MIGVVVHGGDFATKLAVTSDAAAIAVVRFALLRHDDGVSSFSNLHLMRELKKKKRKKKKHFIDFEKVKFENWNGMRIEKEKEVRE